MVRRPAVTGRGGVAEHPKHLAQVGERLLGVGMDDVQRLLALALGQVGPICSALSAARRARSACARTSCALTDEAWDELFDTLTCHRDRALLALTVSNGARASEVLGIRGADVDWGNQLVRVIRKGPGRSSGCR